MSASMDNAGSTGAVQTWPMTTTVAATTVPLPADATTSPQPSPVVQAEDGIVSSPAPQVPENVALPALPLATEAEGESGVGETQTVATPASAPATATASTAQAANFAPPASTSSAVGGTVFALLLVVGVILALAWLAKRMPGIAGSSNPALKIVGSLSLGPRERVVVVAVGDTQLLLSTGPNGTRALHTLSQPLPVTAASSSPFAQVLAQQFGRKKS